MGLVSVRRSAALAYGGVLGRSRRPLLSMRQKHHLLQAETGSLMEDLFFDLARLLDPRLLVECGAHDAKTSCRFVAGAAGRATAPEANPYVHALHADNLAGTGVDYRNAAVGEAPGDAVLNIPSHHRDETSLESSLSLRREIAGYRSVAVPVTTLNAIGQDDISGQRSCLWIDVEGFAGRVLLGGSEVLSDAKMAMIYVEVQDTHDHNEDEWLSLEVASHLEELGFVAVASDYPAAMLYNVLFVRRSELSRAFMRISEFWLAVGQLNLPMVAVPAPRDAVAAARRRLFARSYKADSVVLHRILARLGSVSSQQRLASWSVGPKGS